MDDIERQGGAARAIEVGFSQHLIAKSAYQYELDVMSGRRAKVGVNIYVDEHEESQPPLFSPDPTSADRQVARTAQRVARRDAQGFQAAMTRLRGDVLDKRNVMPALIEAARVGATLGEMADVFRAEFGEFREPSPW
jgi:methylmalonyl-CoA mutase N-terminal domain/subunit